MRTDVVMNALLILLLLSGCVAEPEDEGGISSSGGFADDNEPTLLPPIDGLSGTAGTEDQNQSVEAFAQTLAPILRANCGTCHSSPPTGIGLPPLHGDNDVVTAHVFARANVNLVQPNSSRIYRRLAVESHNCWSDCRSNAQEIEQAIIRWANLIGGVSARAPQKLGRNIVDAEVVDLIQRDRRQFSRNDLRFMRYVSLHELNNRSDVSGADLNTARVGMSKILNSTARWAPEIVNPVDISGEGFVYRIDIRDYWGFSRGESRLPFGGADIELPRDSGLFVRRGSVRPDPEFSLAVWSRIERGNVEAFRGAKFRPNVRGFQRDFVEVTQLAYTLSRPDVYNAVMQIPFFGDQLQRELGLDISQGRDSFDFAVVDDAITLDKRIMWRGQARDGYFWQSTDIFNPDNPFQNVEFSITDTDPSVTEDLHTEQAFTRSRDVFPFYEDPIPNFINPRRLRSLDDDFSFIESVPANRFEPNGEQASAQELIFALPNGLQGYAIYGGTDQRRTDAFTFIVVDPRRGQNVSTREARSLRLLNGASCMSCHESGMKSAPNDLREKLENNELSFSWVNNAEVVSKVRQLYPTTQELNKILSADRAQFMTAMDTIKSELLHDSSLALTEEPLGYLFEFALKLYGYEESVGN